MRTTGEDGKYTRTIRFIVWVGITIFCATVWWIMITVVGNLLFGGPNA